MFTKTFFKLFPPPKLLNVPYAGLDISDDAVRCVEYHPGVHGLKIYKYGSVKLEPGIVEAGYIKNEQALIKALEDLARKTHISHVKVSLPEERMYLFRTEVPTNDPREIRQNIEFKLEENVPLSPTDALFFFDMLPSSISNNKNLASVSVAPKELVNNYISVLEKAGLSVIACEIQPKSIARAVVDIKNTDTLMIIHATDTKVGIYIVCGWVVCFTSTIMVDVRSDIASLKREVSKVVDYWNEYGQGGKIKKTLLSGKLALEVAKDPALSPYPDIPVEIAQVWKNAFSHNKYIPPITFEDSLEYAIAAGLALP